jgi:hypothetical protein
MEDSDEEAKFYPQSFFVDDSTDHSDLQRRSLRSRKSRGAKTRL